jgi:hypothetical protein
MRQQWFTLLLALVVLTRLPFLWLGYGADNDAWLVAHASSTLWHTGEYQPSRLPGYPLYEMVCAPLAGIGGSPLSNSATLVITLLLLAIWVGIARTDARHPKTLAVCLAFTPLVWINSATTMDYLWSLVFLLLAYEVSARKHAVLSGLMVGLATGFRPGNVIAVVPIIVGLLAANAHWRDIYRFVLAALITIVAAYTPLLLRYGLLGWITNTKEEMSDTWLSFSEQAAVFVYRSLYAIGPLALLAAFWIVYRNRTAVRSLNPEQRKTMLVWSAWVATYVLLYAFFPLERAYLLPALPFLYLLVDRLASQRALFLFTAAVVSFAFLNPDVVRHQGTRGSPGFNVHEGMVIEEYQRRQRLLENRTTIATIPVEGKVLIMTGGDAAFWFENELVEMDPDLFWAQFAVRVVRRKSDPEVRFTALLMKNELDIVRNAGYRIYCLESARAFVEKATGYRMDEVGVPLIDSAARRM